MAVIWRRSCTLSQRSPIVWLFQWAKRGADRSSKRPRWAWAAVWLAFAACAAPVVEFEGDEPGECADDSDNDGDGKKNCADPGCAGSAACAPGADVSLANGDSGATGDAGAVADTPSPADQFVDSAAAADAALAPEVVAALDTLVAPDAGPAGETVAEVDAKPAADGTAPADTGPPAACAAPKLSALYDKKIKPLVTKGQPQTCNQCHLAGVDLGLFVQDTPCKTMACMVDKGIVNLAQPNASKVLEWLAKGKPQSALITGAIQGDEKAAFLEWIQFSAVCQLAACGAIANPCGDAGPPPIPPADKPMLGGCGEPALAAAFESQVFKWRDRCSHCHSPSGKDYIKSGAPGWLSADNSSAGSIFSMYNVIGLGLIDKSVAENSSLLLKPLPKSMNGGVIHGGGVKFQNKADVTYIDFLKWIKTYQACVGKGP